MRQITADLKKVRCFQLDPNATTTNWGDSRPAFLITFPDNARLVLKAELQGGGRTKGETQQSARWAGKLMNKVNADVNAKVVTSAELSVFTLLRPDQLFPPSGLLRAYINDLIHGPFAFFKMPYVENLHAADSMDKKGQLSEALDTLRGSLQAIHELGRITAADLFVGNEDRFTPCGNGRLAVNESNLLFKKPGQHLIPVGVDFYHAQAESSNLMVEPASNWPGLWLQSETTMCCYAEAVIAALNAYFSKSLPGVAGHELIPESSSETFVAGMRQGASELKAYLQRRAQGGKSLPNGVAKRMFMLFWAIPPVQTPQAAAPARPTAPPRPTARPQVTTWSNTPAGVQ